jgi:hypothetical protein
MLPSVTLAAQQPVDIALFALTVTPRRDTTLARLADSCITLLDAKLRSLGVTVVRRDSPPLKDWGGFHASRLAIVGEVTRVKGNLDIELDLVEVGTGDELRSYMYRGPDAPNVIALGVAASERIKAIVLEHRK